MAPDAPLAPSAGPGPDRRRTHIRARTGWQAADLGEVWRSRDLLALIALRDIKVRYKQTFFGYAWAVVVPAVQVLVFTVFFGRVLKVGEQVNEATGRNNFYPLFLLTGQVAWNFFNASFTGASGSLMANANIIRKVYVPRLILPLASVGKPAMDAAVVWVLMLGLLLWCVFFTKYDVALTWKLALSPPLLIASLLPAIALGLIAAALTVNYRDLQSILPFTVSMLFYVTPVIYSVELLPDSLSWLLYLNPIAGFVEAHRAAVMDLPLNWLGLAISVAWSLALLFAGIMLFTRIERQFADVS